MAPSLTRRFSVAPVIVTVATILAGCEDPPAETPLAQTAPRQENVDDDPAAPEANADLPRGEGQIRFTVQGGVFPTEVTFEQRSEDMRAMLSGSTLNVNHRPSEEWVADDGQGRVKTLLLSVTEPPEPGTYDTSKYALHFALSPDASGDNAKSISTDGESGTVTITERTDDHVSGSFDVTGRATQVNSTEPVYTLRGEFSFARRRAQR